MMLCFLPINMDIPGPPMEKELFDHVRRYTVADLALASGPAVFWYNHALPLSHTVKPVKHALCAFAAAHRAFLSRDRRRPFGPEHDLAIEHYNSAISQIQPLMSSPTPDNIDAVLICCVIFATLENMVGRHAESMRHLRAGWRLLESYQPDLGVRDGGGGSSSSSTGSPDGGGGGSSSDAPQLFDDVAGMLSRLHLDSAIYVSDDLVPTHGSFLRPVLDMGDTELPFTSVVEAEDKLHDFDVVYTNFLDSIFPSCDSSQGTTSPEPTLNEPSTPFAAGLTWDSLNAVFTRWEARYKLFYDDLQNRGTASSSEMRKATVLLLHSAVWRALVNLKSIEDDISTDECHTILNIAESLAPVVRGSETTPIFAFTAEIVPPLALVGLSCGDDVDMERRTVALLRSLHRRESVWDSQDVAEIIEGIHLAKAQGILDPKELPWGMAEMAGMLAQLQVPSVTNSNGALRFLAGRSWPHSSAG